MLEEVINPRNSKHFVLDAARNTTVLLLLYVKIYILPLSGVDVLAKAQIAPYRDAMHCFILNQTWRM